MNLLHPFSLNLFLWLFSLFNFTEPEGMISNKYKNEIKRFPELYYEIQIAEMNRYSEIGLFYDESVQAYINLYLDERMDQIPGLIAQAENYFPLFEKHLNEYQIPEEIKYVPVIESGLSPYACSPSKARGLWQFKEATASQYGLMVDQFRDDREDPLLSTIAACKYLSDLFDEFGDWQLALIAYNCGPTTLQNAIKNAGGNTDYATIHPFLPKPAQRYIPALIAVIYLLRNFDHHAGSSNSFG